MAATNADNLMRSWDTMREHQVPVDTQTFAGPHNIPAACCALASTKRLRTPYKSTNTRSVGGRTTGRMDTKTASNTSSGKPTQAK